MLLLHSHSRSLPWVRAGGISPHLILSLALTGPAVSATVECGLTAVGAQPGPGLRDANSPQWPHSMPPERARVRLTPRRPPRAPGPRPPPRGGPAYLCHLRGRQRKHAAPLPARHVCARPTGCPLRAPAHTRDRLRQLRRMRRTGQRAGALLRWLLRWPLTLRVCSRLAGAARRQARCAKEDSFQSIMLGGRDQARNRGRQTGAEIGRETEKERTRQTESTTTAIHLFPISASPCVFM
jgi:hypothetical protein